jgi:hypothetical protein
LKITRPRNAASTLILRAAFVKRLLTFHLATQMLLSVLAWTATAHALVAGTHLEMDKILLSLTT